MMSPPTELLTFEDLTEVYRREQRSKNITEVRRDFYPAIRDCLERLKRESEREFAVDQFSTKAKLASNQLTRFQEKVTMVYGFRMEKILAMALRAAEGNKVDCGRLTIEEREVFDRVSFLLKERRSVMLEGTRLKVAEAEEVTTATRVPEMVAELVKEGEVFDLPSSQMTAPVVSAPAETTIVKEEAPAPPPIVQPSPAGPTVPDVPPVIVQAPEQPAPTPQTVVKAAETSDHVLLRILEDLPPIAGGERNYKLKKEDLVSLPPTIAKALIARKKAVGVQNLGPKKD